MIIEKKPFWTPNKRRILGRIFSWVCAAALFAVIYTICYGFVNFVLYSAFSEDNYGNPTHEPIQVRLFSLNAMIWIMFFFLGIGFMGGFVIKGWIVAGRVEEKKE